jgi:hypothetical protein
VHIVDGRWQEQSMIVTGILALFPQLASIIRSIKVDADVKTRRGRSVRSTNHKVWIQQGNRLSAEFTADQARSETEWCGALKNRAALILLDQWRSTSFHAPTLGRSIRTPCGNASRQSFVCNPLKVQGHS